MIPNVRVQAARAILGLHFGPPYWGNDRTRPRLTASAILLVLALAGCRKAANPAFQKKASVDPTTIERVVLYAQDPRKPRSGFCYFESTDPRLIADAVRGLRTSSVLRSEDELRTIEPLFLVPKVGPPLYFGVKTEDAEDQHGAVLAGVLAHLMRGPSLPEFEAHDRNLTRLTDLRGRAR